MESNPLNSPPKNTKKIFFLVFGLFGFLSAALLGYFFYLDYQARQEEKSAQEKLQRAKQLKMDAEKHLHDLVLAQIEKIKDQGISPPPCPLIYPLLDAKGKVTPLGSYLSYFSMKCATYLPQEVYLLPNPGLAFDDFGLFNVLNSKHGTYITQLPYRLGTQDTAKGILKIFSKGYRIDLKFSRGSKTKKYQRVFKKGSLHLAPAWMAGCIHDWTDFHPTVEEEKYMQKPIFIKDDDLIRAASLEWIIRGGGAELVNRWDEILKRNPENPYLVDRWANILEARNKAWVHSELFGLYNPLIAKYPNSTFLKLSLCSQLECIGMYDEALAQIWPEMVKDDNNPDFYNFASLCLEWKGYYPECYQLFKVWTDKHPENAQAWMGFADFMIDYGWQARGGGFANTVSQKAWEIFKQRINEGLGYALKASNLEPGNIEVWNTLLHFGNGAQLDHVTMFKYFENAIHCNPQSIDPYEYMLDYLQPKWFGSEEELFGFAEKYKKDFPSLYSYAFSNLHQHYSDDPLTYDEWLEKFKLFVKENPAYWNEFKDSYKKQLKQNPEQVETWENYLSWLAETDEEKEVLIDAKKISHLTPELKALYPYMVLNTNNTMAGKYSTSQKGDYFSRPGPVKQTFEAYSMLLDLDPHNWNIWNRMARFSWKISNLEKTKEAFMGIGSHWDATVWDEDSFDKAKAVVLGGSSK